MHALDPLAAKIRDRQEILVSGEPARFEATHLIGRHRARQRRTASTIQRRDLIAGSRRLNTRIIFFY
jgi:hypothetical protein